MRESGHQIIFMLLTQIKKVNCQALQLMCQQKRVMPDIKVKISQYLVVP